jgi:hypothetical protein
MLKVLNHFKCGHIVPNLLRERLHLSSARRERRPYGRQSPQGVLGGATDFLT